MSDNKPSWNDAPDWAEWLAQDADGWWYWYRGDIEKGPHHRPGASRFTYWDDRDMCHERAAKGNPNPNWRETLERRPEADNELFDKTAKPPQPDLIIPMDALDRVGWLTLSEHIVKAGYRLEIDSDGIRGWRDE